MPDVTVQNLVKGTHRFSLRSEGDGSVKFTEYPGDTFVLGQLMEFSGWVLTGTGEQSLTTLTSYDYYAGTVWRFHGELAAIPRLLIAGSEADPLAFYLVEGVGPVYLNGTGTVRRSDGELLFDNRSPVGRASDRRP